MVLSLRQTRNDRVAGYGVRLQKLQHSVHRRSAVLGFMFNDNKYGFFHRKNKEARDEYTQQYFEMLDNLYNVVSIGMWVPFNEGWGQFDSAWFSERTKEFDATRTVDSASGWHDQGIDAKSIHCYFTPFKVPKKKNDLFFFRNTADTVIRKRDTFSTIRNSVIAFTTIRNP